MLLGAPLAVAAQCPPIVFGPPHASRDEVAIATLHSVFSDNDAYEWGGFLIEQNGAFRASKPVTQRARSEVNYCILLPRNAKLAGLYHTHVANAAFSPRDRRNAARAGVPSYIGTIRGGTLLVLEPDAGKVRSLPVRAATPGNAPGQPISSVLCASVQDSLLERFTLATQRVWDLLLEAWSRI